MIRLCAIFSVCYILPLFSSDKPKELTITFLDGAQSYIYTISDFKDWDQSLRNTVRISQKEDSVLVGFKILMNGQPKEVKNFWAETWKSYNFIQRSILLELIYAIGAQGVLLPNNDSIKYVIELDWNDSGAKLYLTLSDTEMSQFIVIKDIIVGVGLQNGLVPISMQYDEDFEKDHALKSLELLFNFVQNVASVNDFESLNQDQNNALRDLFSNASSKYVLQGLLWAHKFGLIEMKCNKLIDIYVDILCNEIKKSVPLDNVAIITTPVELKKKVWDCIVEKIAEVKGVIDSYVKGANNIVVYQSMQASNKEDIIYATHQINTRKKKFDTTYDEQIKQLNTSLNVKDALNYYKSLLPIQQEYMTDASNLEDIPVSRFFNRFKLKAYNWYYSFSNAAKNRIQWFAGATAAIGAVGLAGWLWSKYGRTGAMPSVLPTQQSAVTGKLLPKVAR